MKHSIDGSRDFSMRSKSLGSGVTKFVTTSSNATCVFAGEQFHVFYLSSKVSWTIYAVCRLNELAGDASLTIRVHGVFLEADPCMGGSRVYYY